VRGTRIAIALAGGFIGATNGCAPTSRGGMPSSSGAPVPLPRATVPYDSLRARLSAGDLAIDYLSLRLAYAESPYYSPYDFRTESKKAMRAAIDADDCRKALAVADSILKMNYVDIESHLVLARCLERAGDVATARRHATIAQGLLQSIRGYASGRTPDSAIVVISIDEEHAFLAMHGLEQTLVAGVNCGGHLCDAIQTVDRASGKTQWLYFNVGIPFRWTASRIAKDSTRRRP
jgi:hypothetical protein